MYNSFPPLVSYISVKSTTFKSLNKKVTVSTIIAQTAKQAYYFVPTLQNKSMKKVEHNSSTRRAGDKKR